jgi:hypothetical protein
MGKQPTVKELLTAIPSLNPLHREDAIFDRLQNEPAFSFSSYLRQVRPNLGWDIVTSATVQNDLKKELQAQGFVAGRITKLPQFEHGPAVQQQWERHSDWTHVSIIVFENDLTRVAVSCQGPQKPTTKRHVDS